MISSRSLPRARITMTRISSSNLITSIKNRRGIPAVFLWAAVLLFGIRVI